MRKIIILFTIFAFTVSLTSCVTTNQSGEPDAGRTAESGAILGALGGAITGFLSTGKIGGAIRGAAIGAAVGGLTGYIIGKEKERQYKNAQQIYRENPGLASKNARNKPPTIVNMTPVILNERGLQVQNIKNGKNVELGIHYTLHIPKHSQIHQYEVIEYNTLVASDGKKMDLPSRKKIRECAEVESGIEVKLPNNLPSGKYTHYASVVVGNQKYETSQQIYITMLNSNINVYALN
ncbi:MAG: glycine zipper domain-containing protein [Chlorobium sp.]